MLRNHERPTPQTLILAMPNIEQMASLYPNWLHIVTNTQNIVRWRAWEREIVSAPASTTSQPPPVSPARAPANPTKAEPLGPKLAMAFLSVVALGVLLWWSAPIGKSMLNAGPVSAQAAPESLADALRQFDPNTVNAPARYRTPPKVSYPALAKREGLQGQVVVGVLIRKDGEIGDVRVVLGSGHALLDEAAVRGVRTATFYPARMESLNVEAWYNAAINFRLDEAPRAASGQ
jgi:protein TonB